MAGIATNSGREPPLASGPLSILARSQYRALASMRWSMFRNSLRTPKGAIELGARTIAFAFYGFMGLAMAAGFGAGAYAIAGSEKWEYLPALFWVLFVMWQVVPVTLASFQEHFDLGGLLRFPVGFGAFFLLHLIFGLVDASTMMGALCCAGIWIGLLIARSNLYIWSTFPLVLFAAFNILLVRAISAWLDRWLAQRRTREIVGALFFLAILSIQLLNPAYWSTEKHPGLSAQVRATGFRVLGKANSFQRWLPPGLAARELQQTASLHPLSASKAAALLGIYVIGVGSALGFRLHGEYRGENFSEAPAQKHVVHQTHSRLLGGSGPIAAVIEKEARVLTRAMPLIYALAAPLVMVFLLAGAFTRHGAHGGHASPFSWLLSLAYALVGFTQLFYNNLGPEGPGIQMLLLSPTPMRTVILAKNLFHSTVFLIDAVLVCALASLRVGAPSGIAIAATAAWALFALPVHLAAGNAFSLIMPYRMNLGRITRQRGSQVSALLSMLIQLGVLGVGAGIFVACSFLQRLWLAVPILLTLAMAAFFVWKRVLDNIDTITGRRRESLLATFVRAD
jgi:ABC-2 type transport system permease protein